MIEDRRLVTGPRTLFFSYNVDPLLEFSIHARCSQEEEARPQMKVCMLMQGPWDAISLCRYKV